MVFGSVRHEVGSDAQLLYRSGESTGPRGEISALLRRFFRHRSRRWYASDGKRRRSNGDRATGRGYATSNDRPTRSTRQRAFLRLVHGRYRDGGVSADRCSGGAEAGGGG